MPSDTGDNEPQVNGTLGQEEVAVYKGRAVARLISFAELDHREKERLAAMAGTPFTLKRGEAIRGHDEAPTSLHLMIDGWAASAIGFADGSRQLTAISLPGDLLGLPALAVAAPIDAIVALSPVTVCPIPVAAFSKLLADEPRLAAILYLISQEERMFAMERLALAGRATASARLAAMLLRLQERVEQFDDSSPHRFAMPLTQQEMGDLVGVSAVHVNALVRDLRDQDIAVIQNRTLHILDFEALKTAAGVAAWSRASPDWLPARRA